MGKCYSTCANELSDKAGPLLSLALYEKPAPERTS